MSTKIPMPDGLVHWTADSVAECLEYSKHMASKEESWKLYRKLWGFLNEAENPTPLGGDGSNGTVEYPDAQRNPDNDDKTPHWWGRLTFNEQRAISLAYEAM